MDTLLGKVAVVTGAASGIGRSMALRFARAGMKVVPADVDDARLAQVGDEINNLGAHALVVHTDVANAAAHDRLLGATLERFGQANVVCLNAGVTGSVGRSWTLTEQDWRWSLGILLDGVIFGIKAFGGHLVAQGDGHFVITASIVGHITAPYSGPYLVAKHGVAALAESLELELRADKADVGVTCLCPGFVNTAIVSSAKARPTSEPGATKDEIGDRWMACPTGPFAPASIRTPSPKWSTTRLSLGSSGCLLTTPGMALSASGRSRFSNAGRQRPACRPAPSPASRPRTLRHWPPRSNRQRQHSTGVPSLAPT